MQDIYNRARNIRVAAFDVDGVLTDGALYYADSGEELKAFNVHDGHGMRMLQDSGVTLAIITSRTFALRSRRGRATSASNCCTRAPRTNSRRSGSCWAAAALDGDGMRLHGRRPGRSAGACGAADWPRRCPDAPALVRRHAHVRDPGPRRATARCAKFCELILHAQGIARNAAADHAEH